MSIGSQNGIRFGKLRGYRQRASSYNPFTHCDSLMAGELSNLTANRISLRAFTSMQRPRPMRSAAKR